MHANNKRVFLKILTNLTKKGYVIKNYLQHPKLKMFKFENDITLLLVGSITLLRCEVWIQDNALGFPCWHPRWYMMTNWNRNKNNAHQAWRQFKTQIVMKYYKFLWYEYIVISCWAPSSKWCHSSKASTVAKSSLSWIS